VSVNNKQKGQFMIAKLLKWKVGSDAIQARVAEVVFVLAACLFPAMFGLKLLKMQLSPWQALVCCVALACLGLQFIILSLLCRVLRRNTGAA
jgi:hypothetical protein